MCQCCPKLHILTHQKYRLCACLFVSRRFSVGRLTNDLSLLPSLNINNMWISPSLCFLLKESLWFLAWAGSIKREKWKMRPIIHTSKSLLWMGDWQMQLFQNIIHKCYITPLLKLKCVWMCTKPTHYFFSFSYFVSYCQFSENW